MANEAGLLLGLGAIAAVALIATREKKPPPTVIQPPGVIIDPETGIVLEPPPPGGPVAPPIVIPPISDEPEPPIAPPLPPPEETLIDGTGLPLEARSLGSGEMVPTSLHGPLSESPAHSRFFEDQIRGRFETALFNLDSEEMREMNDWIHSQALRIVGEIGREKPPGFLEWTPEFIAALPSIATSLSVMAGVIEVAPPEFVEASQEALASLDPAAVNAVIAAFQRDFWYQTQMLETIGLYFLSPGGLLSPFSPWWAPFGGPSIVSSWPEPPPGILPGV